MTIHLHHMRRAAVRITAAAAATALAVAGLTACSGGSSSSDGTTTITFSLQNDNVKKTDPGIWYTVQAFEKKYPKIKVKVEGQPVEQHIQAMNLAAQNNRLPEIFWIYDANAKDMAKAGKVLDLAPALKDLGISKNFSSSSLAAFNNGSSQYGIPAGTLVTGFYFNNDVLKANGLEMPVTFDDYLNYCKVVSKTGVVPIAQGANQSAYSVWGFLGMLSRFGYEKKSKSILSGSSSYVNSDFRKFYDSVQQMQKANCFPSNVSTQTFAQAVDSFLNSSAGSLDSGAWSSSAIDGSSLKGKVSFSPGPTFSDGVGNQKLVINVPSAPYAVAATVKKDSAKYDAVKKFLGFYYSKAGQQIQVDYGLTPSTNLPLTIDKSKSPTFDEVVAAANAEGYVSPSAQPDLVVPTAVANAMYDSIYGVVQGATTPDAALEQVQKAFDAAR